MKRREFLKTSVAVLGSTSLFNLAYSQSIRKLDKIGVQLYSVRDLMKDDFDGTITKLAEAGYNQVEFAGYYDRDPKEIRALLDKLGITAPSTHVGYNLLTGENLAKTLEISKILGHEFIIMPSLPRDFSNTGQQRPAAPPPPPPPPPPASADQAPKQEGQAPAQRQWQRPPEPVYTVEKVKEIAGVFNELGKKCQAAGFKFAYHNHTMEFKKTQDGDIMYDIMLKETDPSLVDFEMDLGWAIAGGVDPLEYFKNYPNRFKLFHIKDFDTEKKPCVIGTGTIEYAPIFAKADQAGALYYVVEYEGREDTLGSCIACEKFLRKMTF